MAIREWDDIFIPFNSLKALVHGKHFEAILSGQYLTPVVVNLDVSGQCPYNCPHCHHRAQIGKDRSLPFLDERLARTFPAFMKNWIIRDSRPLGCCIVGSRGDALLFKGLPKLLRELHFAGIETGLVTNGYLFSDILIDHATHYCKFIGISVDAGDSESYYKVHRSPNGAWHRVLDNLRTIVGRIAHYRLRNDTCYKFLILPDSYHTLYQACRIAKDIGVRWVQIRPADLSDEERAKIDIDKVNEQIELAMNDLNAPGTFEIVGVRHKFTPDFKAILPSYCWLTALTVTITSDGKCWPCVDRRWDEKTLLADCGTGGGWQELREAWGSAKHIKIVHNIINRGGKGPDCGIRCSNYGYDQLFRRVFLSDDMDRVLI
ncbi:MAG TPA: radical SAM protein [bacterium]|nr:radical SAM protein [bacterium]